VESDPESVDSMLMDVDAEGSDFDEPQPAKKVPVKKPAAAAKGKGKGKAPAKRKSKKVVVSSCCSTVASPLSSTIYRTRRTRMRMRMRMMTLLKTMMQKRKNYPSLKSLIEPPCLSLFALLWHLTAPDLFYSAPLLRLRKHLRRRKLSLSRQR
jgi:hypothetical protein